MSLVPPAPVPTIPAAQAEAVRIARGGAAPARAALAALPDTAPELLYYLAADPDLPVRAAVAANAGTPPQADRILAGDPDPRIRAILGRKLAGLAPRLGGATTDRLVRMAWDTLRRLAADAAETVRAMIAEEVKALPDAPRALILQLAADACMSVAEPVIRFSPRLTEADLLGLVASPAAPATLVAVARRPGLGSQVADALAATEDPIAIAAMLGNPSATIREATLDRLVATAAGHPDWQEKLVVRPGLSAWATLALARCVADHLLEPLVAHADLAPGQAAALAAAVRRRLEAQATAPPWQRILAPVEGAPAPLGEAERASLLTALAARAGVPEARLRHALALRSAKALVSLCWKAGLTPRCALQVQILLGGIASPLALHPTPSGGWPLAEPEMAWHLALLDGDATAEGAAA